MNTYNDKYILRKIIETNFSFHDLNPKKFPKLVHGTGLYCPWHDSTHTGNLNARIYYNDERDIFYIHCYVEQRNFTSYDYVSEIMCKQKGLFTSPKEFLLSRMSKEDFLTQYKLFENNMKTMIESQFKKKCAYIDNTYNSTGNTIDYIEALYLG